MYDEFNRSVEIDYYFTLAEMLIREKCDRDYAIDRNAEPVTVIKDLFSMCRPGTLVYDSIEFYAGCINDCL